VTSDVELMQCARLLLDRFGEEGAIDHATKRMMELVDEDNMEGAAIWKGIRQAVQNIIDSQRDLKDTFH
tara:strand:+ start:534 stop:740 length:207 start_codon:yes stop_codon:yes gene_type:complete